MVHTCYALKRIKSIDFLVQLYMIDGEREKLIGLLQQSYECALVKMPRRFPDERVVRPYIVRFKELLFQLM